MAYLWFVTLLWAFSFSLIGVYLSGHVDSYFAVLTRIALASLLFAPLLVSQRLALRHAWRLMAIGAMQIGVMYIFFYQSFAWLTVPEVLLFTIFTPVYITVIDDLIVGRFSPVYLVSAMIAVAGAAIIRYRGVGDSYWIGFGLVQGANISFAIGQVAYRHLAPSLPDDTRPSRLFGWFFLGALPIAALAFLCLGNTARLPTTNTQWLVLLWLGLGASGLGYFLWNQGAARVDAGTLAIMNNVLIPAGLIVNVAIWNHDVDIVRLGAGGGVMLAALGLNTALSTRRNRKPRLPAG